MSKDLLFSVTKKDLTFETFRAGGKGARNRTRPTRVLGSGMRRLALWPNPDPMPVSWITRKKRSVVFWISRSSNFG